GKRRVSLRQQRRSLHGLRCAGAARLSLSPEPDARRTSLRYGVSARATAGASARSRIARGRAARAVDPQRSDLGVTRIARALATRARAESALRRVVRSRRQASLAARRDARARVRSG